MERLGKMTRRTRYGGEGCGWIWAGLRMRAFILAEISSENLLPIRADFVTERVTRLLVQHTYQATQSYYLNSPMHPQKCTPNE